MEFVYTREFRLSTKSLGKWTGGAFARIGQLCANKVAWSLTLKELLEEPVDLTGRSSSLVG
jgi:hypothetical protein